jgi:polyisoprenoid-binding protein YceI
MPIRTAAIAALTALASLTGGAQAAEYALDIKDAHAFVNFRFKHLGISWLSGEFREFDGRFTYDPDNFGSSTIEMSVDVASIDTNHAERDKHMREPKYLDIGKFPTASFVSTRFEERGDGKFTVYGDLTLHGVTKPIAIDGAKVGEGDDPWGGYRAGFEGTFTLNTKDFGLENFRPLHQVEMHIMVEGIRE